MLNSVLHAINYVSSLWLKDFHESVADIEYDKQNNTIEISIQIFVDNLEEGMKI